MPISSHNQPRNTSDRNLDWDNKKTAFQRSVVEKNFKERLVKILRNRPRDKFLPEVELLNRYVIFGQLLISILGSGL